MSAEVAGHAAAEPSLKVGAHHQPSGQHLLADCHGVDARLLADLPALRTLLLHCARQAGAHVVGSHFHHFGVGGGVTGVVLLAESHISVHTWPESGFLAADVFMCGAADARAALAALIEGVGAVRHDVTEVVRGRRVED